jgi:hypothetical protein
VCRKEPTPEVAPQPEQPVKNICVLQPRDKGTCENLAKAACGSGVTSLYNTCRSLYVKFCTNPQGVTDEESCLRERADTATAKGKKDEDTRRVCRKGLAQQCAEQVCRKQPTPPDVPKAEPKKEKSKSKPAKVLEQPPKKENSKSKPKPVPVAEPKKEKSKSKSAVPVVPKAEQKKEKSESKPAKVPEQPTKKEKSKSKPAKVLVPKVLVPKVPAQKKKCTKHKK